MARVLITGLSGVGKSSVVTALASRGRLAVDTDVDGWCRPPDEPDDAPVASPYAQPGWLWREGRMRTLLETEPTVAVAGCVENQGRFMRDFDHVVLLTASWEVVEHRLATRTTNSFGRDPSERAAIRDEWDMVEPLLRRGATLVIDTGETSPTETVDIVDSLLD